MTTTKRFGRAPGATASPGDVLEAVLVALGITQADLARSIGSSTKHVNQIVQGVATLSVPIARQLQGATGIPARLWLALEASYQLGLTDDEPLDVGPPGVAALQEMHEVTRPKRTGESNVQRLLRETSAPY